MNKSENEAVAQKQNWVDAIIREVTSVLERVPPSEVFQTAQRLQEARRIFVVGEGRSGLMAKSFAMRLMHLGATVYVVGETITPAIQAEDTLLAVSGSGHTEAVVATAAKAKRLGCFVLALTTDADSELAKSADMIVRVPAATKYRQSGESPSIQPLGSLFDQSVHLLLDAICLCYAQWTHEDNSSALQRHRNL
ncbi:6-phospho-3-hexuloisomerase [Alicyclobacillaceae bacterium I2511]|jgi:6-phospho-3-hexuloisomerase|nr:6-phospho-3-hexuloisomerase [Alicyclobacillaceae bacterium I2511]